MTQPTPTAAVPPAPRPRRALHTTGPLQALAWAIGGLVGLLAAAMLWFVTAQPVQVLPRMQPLPAFSLHDQRGRWLTDSELRGHMLLISFGYSRCEAACAEATALMQTLYSAAAQQPLVLLTISLDEADASKAALGAYAARLGATDNNWRVLGGEAAEIKALVGGGFGVYYHNDPNSGAPPLVRDQRVVLVDADGVVRAEYAGARLDAQRIARDIALVQREATSRGLTRSLYDAAHLFVCYPD